MTERGLALPVAILALALIGALVGVAVHTGMLEQRIGRNGAYAAEALAAAEAGVVTVLAEWEAHPELGALGVHQGATLAGIVLSERVSVQPAVVRLTDVLYLVTGEGVRADAEGGVLARRRVAMLVRAVDGGAVPLRQRSWVAW